MKKILQIIFICCFVIILAVPLIMADFSGGKVSETEKRTLAEFPVLFGENALSVEEVPDALENWIGDNIGFRDLFRKIYQTISYKGFKISTSDKVHFGKDNWLFYTLGNNVNLATGESIISEDKLEKIARNQQAISDSYKRCGKEYYFLILPSKSTVYPEKLIGEYSVMETNADIVEKYLLKNTDVNVINLKNVMLKSKDSEYTPYWKTDTHWTPYGSYIGYKSVMERLVADGTADMLVDFNPEFFITDEKYNGDLVAMAGESAVEMESTISVQWDNNFYIDKKSDKFTELDECLDEVQKNKLAEISRNECRYVNDSTDINDKTLLIYGDSMFLEHNKASSYFAENFSTVQYVRVRTPLKSIDSVVEPDIVIFEVFERYLDSVAVIEPADYFND